MPVKPEEIQNLIDMDLWEEMWVDDEKEITRVPGGWIFTTVIDDHSGPGRAVSETFIPIPDPLTGKY